MPDALLRAGMFVIVASVVGAIAEQMNSYRDQLARGNRELQEANILLKSSQSAYETANKKLNLLSSITRHDIRNQVTGLMGFLELSRMKTTDPDQLHLIEREETAARSIQRQIEFTKSYEDIGVRAPQWQDILEQVNALRPLIPPGEIEFSVTVDGLGVFADPLLGKVFENLIDNSLRHGERVRHISFFTRQGSPGSIVLVYEDDGVGVPAADKGRLFEKGFGKHTGLGLFLTREILAITGLTIQETGVYGQGARFEIQVPAGKYRVFKMEQETGT